MTIRTNSSIYNYDWSDNTWKTDTPTTASVTLSGVTESKTIGIDCSNFWAVQTTYVINYAATPTDSIEINYYGGLVLGALDNRAMDTVDGDKTLDPEQITKILMPPPKILALGFVQSGLTDSHVISSIKVVGYY